MKTAIRKAASRAQLHSAVGILGSFRGFASFVDVGETLNVSPRLVSSLIRPLTAYHLSITCDISPDITPFSLHSSSYPHLYLHYLLTVSKQR